MKRAWSIVVRAVLAMLVLGVLAVGIGLAISQRSASDTTAKYDALPRCPSGTPISASDCWAWQTGTIVALRQDFTTVGARRDLVSFRTPELAGTAEVEPTTAYMCAAPGEPVVAKFWKGSLTGFYTPHGVIVGAGSLNVGPNDRLEAGMLLISAALIVPVGALVARRLRRGKLTIGGPIVPE